MAGDCQKGCRLCCGATSMVAGEADPHPDTHAASSLSRMSLKMGLWQRL